MNFLLFPNLGFRRSPNARKNRRGFLDYTISVVGSNLSKHNARPATFGKHHQGRRIWFISIAAALHNLRKTLQLCFSSLQGTL